MQFWAQTKAKAEEGHENQDAYLAQTEGPFALADGAGAYGVFSGPWAQALLDNLPQQALTTIAELDEWLDSWCEKFTKDSEEKMQTRPFLKTKFYREGSAATLVAAWVIEAEKQLHLLSYGDSFYAFYDGQTWHFPEQRNNLIKYKQNPYLLNWAEETSSELGFSYQKLPYNDGAKLLLSSDALGQFILALWAKQQGDLSPELRQEYRLKEIFDSETWHWQTLWTELETTLTQPANFEAWLEERKQVLEEDDYTAVYVKF